MKRILASALALFWVVAFGAPPKASAAEAPITIGFINHLSGDISLYGQSMKLGTQLAVDTVNKSGGINGRPLQVEYLDDASQINQAVAAAHKLVQENVPLAIGSSASSFTLAIAPIFEQAHIVLMNSVSTNPKLADVGPYFFAMMPGDDEQGAAWNDVAKKMHITEAAVVYINNDYGNGVKNVFVKDFTASGGKVLGTIAVTEGSTDYRTDVLKLKDLHPKYTFIVCHTKEGSLLLKQAQELALTTQWIGDTAMGTDDLIKADGSIVNGMYALSVGQKGHPKYVAFSKAFEEANHEKPTIWSDFAYDTLMLAADALRHAGSDPAKIQQYLAHVHDWQGATGVVNFNDHGIRLASHAFALYQVKGGQWTELARKL